ncbi:MAG: GNAT family N-acetyltransferase [Bacilli bacterium]|nr:GNAT family N-acetyltransferase [Bacilli bacterium]
MNIRKKELKDCEIWVDINIKGWNDNLKGIVSDKLLKLISDNRDSRIEKDITEFEVNDWNYVLEDGNKVIGILKIKQSNRDGYEDCGEVQVLYLYTNEKGKGFGRALINKAFNVLKEKGYKKVVIGCLVGNPSNNFYKHIGGKYVRQEPLDILGEHYIENVYEYEI